ncbi:MAG: hypothetical protein IPK75_18135 [Acidobacteria bacterium]|nr:hypothetical protein [Acidobacteriota bacterium]
MGAKKPGKVGKPGKIGRPKLRISVDEIEKLGALNATQEEIAGWFGCSLATIEKRLQQPRYREAYERGRARGRLSVRREQIELMKKGSATMAIWLGKQLLGQRDVTASEVTGAGGGPQEHKIVVEYARIPPKTTSATPGPGAGEE